MTPYYQDDAVTLYHGDCRDVFPIIEPSPGNLLLTDPPYGILLDNDWQNTAHKGTAPNVASGGMRGDDGSVNWAAFCRVIQKRVVFGFPYLSDHKATGWFIWDKEPGFKGRSLTSPVEMAYSTTWSGFRVHRLLWSGYLRVPDAEPKYGHPTQKPEALMRQIIRDHPDAQVVIDFFAGSGTTLRAAKDLGRKSIGIEIEERYCEIAAKRCSQEVLQFGSAECAAPPA